MHFVFLGEAAKHFQVRLELFPAKRRPGLRRQQERVADSDTDSLITDVESHNPHFFMIQYLNLRLLFWRSDLNSKSKYAILLISSVLVIYAIVGSMLGRVSAQNGSFSQLSIFTEVLSRIQNDYVDDPNIKGAMDGAIRGLVESVDPYGGYLN